MSNKITASNQSAWSQLEDDDDLLLLNEDLNLNTSSLRSDERYVGFDNNVGDTWLYPSNFPERSYQYNIVQKALFHNTLVVLPTGLGKTFIAAVVMYNIYRWYPMGKVIFMAPTRPLVAQQIDACCKIMGIPKNDSVEITGKLNKASRAQLWQSKRVFFATPQSVLSDLTDGELNFPFEAVKLIVVDEAHRSKGRYAYTDVVSSIWKKNKYFRVLGLSATPGRRKDDVEEVIRNLFISNLEVRTEDSVDVVSYVHRRQIKTVVVELGNRLGEIRDKLLAIVDPHIRRLIDNRLITGRPGNISRNWLVMEHKRFRQSLVNNRVPNQKELNSDFNISISVYHSIELLERHGLRVFLNNFDETHDGGTKFVVILRPDLRLLIERVRQEIGPNPFAFSDQCMVNGEIAAIPNNIDFGHPKFEIARDHVVAHFKSNKDARVIIFCEYRESVMLMHRLLLQHRPLIRPRVFVGQGGTGSIRAVTQQQQINVMNDFRSGVSNALIATSVAEEGIDVGEVDLIVCFDINTSNPTRFIQRIGRTGRKKEGKVLLLATEGKEHAILKEVLSERNKLNKSISRGGEFASVFYKQAPRMVPTEFNPKCLKTFITAPQEQALKSKEKPAQSKAKAQQTAKMGQKRDLRHFFKQKVVLDDEEKCVFETSEASRSFTTSKSTANRSRILDEIQAIMDRSSSEANKAMSASTTKLEENQTIMDFSPPKQSDISKKSVKNISKYMRSSLKRQIVDVQKSLTTNQLSKDSLQFLIDFSPDLLLNIWTRMETMWNKGINENNLPAKGISADDRQTVLSYLQLIKVFGSKENLATTVERRSENPKDYCFSILIEKYGFIFRGACHGSGTNFQFLMQKFEQMAALFPSDEHSGQSFVLSTVYDDEIDDNEGSFGQYNDSSHNFSNDRIMDSKYMSQWVTSTEDLNSMCEFPKETTSTHNKIERIVSKPMYKNKGESEDDVVFVGVIQQSTPIRPGSLKQSVLNFSETPIARKVSGLFKKLKSMSSNAASAELVVKLDSGPPVKTQSDEIHIDFFDDQFDAILAANSGVFEHIEKSNAIDQDAGQKCTYQQISVKEKTTTFRGSYDSTSDKSCLKNATRVTSNSKVALGVSDSTPDDISALIYDSSIAPPDDSTPNEIISLAATTNNGYNSNVLQSASSQNVVSNAVHPELADIDFNVFSDTFSDDSTDKVQLDTPAEVSLQGTISPDLFEDLSQSTSETNVKEKSSVNIPPEEVSPCLITKKPITWKEVRLKYFKPSQIAAQKPHSDQLNDSDIHVRLRIRPKRRIISSDSESSDDISSPLRKSKAVPLDNQNVVRRVSIHNPRVHKRRTNEFIEDEAALSGSATEDELDETRGCYMIDSVMVHDDDVENDDSVNMTQVYLQSVRSPSGNLRGAFKIPPRRQFNDASKIFSQRVPEEDDGSYITDSFVIRSDEESDVEHSMCPLERAEAILEEKRRVKRKARMFCETLKPPPKRKRVLRIHNSSEDDDDFQ